MDRYAIGRNITSELRKRGWTTRRLAQELNLCEATVSNWTLGKRTPNAYGLYRIARTFRIPMENLMRGVDGDEKKD